MRFCVPALQSFSVRMYAIQGVSSCISKFPHIQPASGAGRSAVSDGEGFEYSAKVRQQPNDSAETGLDELNEGGSLVR